MWGKKELSSSGGCVPGLIRIQIEHGYPICPIPTRPLPDQDPGRTQQSSSIGVRASIEVRVGYGWIQLPQIREGGPLP